ncbi:MAG: hypothetical protein KIT29_03505 [Anaerolineales bacterium]|jgi:hypothetical protein|nr:hypothetical protein [Anaerolineales bacterium]
MSPFITAILIHLATAGLFAFVGWRLRHRQHADALDQRAWRAFLCWWFGMGLNAALMGLSMLLRASGLSALWFFVALNLLGTLAAGVALWGLISYLLYVFRGDWRHSRWVAAFYIAFGLYLLYTVVAFVPTAATLTTWQVLIEYQRTPGPLYPVGLLLLFGLPPILASLAFLRIFFSLRERSARYRAVMVTLGIFLQFAVPFIMPIILYLFGILTPKLPWWPLTYRLVGLLGLLLLYFAYSPPRFVQDWLRVNPL